MITRIKESEVQQCAELYVGVFNAAPWNDEWTVETAYERLHDIYLTPNFFGLVYKEDGVIKGALFGNCEQWYEGKHYTVKEMFVSTTLQGTGIGSQLMKTLEAEVVKLGVKSLILFTSKGNQTSEFYLKNNFRELGSMAMMFKDL